MLVQNKAEKDCVFAFNEASLSDKERELRLLNPNKTYTVKNIPPKILKKADNIVRMSCKNYLE